MREEEKIITRKGVAKEVGCRKRKFENESFNWTDKVRVGLHRKEYD